MTEVALDTKRWTFKDGKDPEDPEYRKNLLVPANIKMDLSLVKDKKRVATVLECTGFREELEGVVNSHVKSNEYPAMGSSTLSLQQIVDMLSPAPGKKPSSVNGYTKAQKNQIIPINDLRSGANSFYSRNERLLRCKLASIFRLMDLFRWNNSSDAYVTARVSREKEHFLINPFGLLLQEVTASSLMKIDSQGNVIDGGSSGLGLKNESWQIHSYVHAARPDIRVAIHIATETTIAVSLLDRKLLPLCTEAMILGPISYYESVQSNANSNGDLPATPNEQVAIAEALGPTSKVLFIRSMGVFAMGETIDEAWHYASNLIVACQTQLLLASVPEEDLCLPTQEQCQQTFDAWRTAEMGGLPRREAAMAMRLTHAAEQKRRKQAQDQQNKKAASAEPALNGSASMMQPTPWRLGELEFEALMRHLDNAGYRTGHLYRYGAVAPEDSSTLSKTTSGYVSPRVASPTPISTTKGRRSRAQSPATQSVSSGALSEDEIEVPPYASSVAANMAYFFSDDEDGHGSGLSGDESDAGLRSPNASLRPGQSLNKTWFNTPNSYSKKQILVFDSATGKSNPTKCWISDREAALMHSLTVGVAPPIPAHPLTPGAIPLGATGGMTQTSTLPLSASLSRGVGNKALLNQYGLVANHVAPNQFAPQGDNPNEFKEQQKRLKNKYYKDLNSSGPQSRLLDSLTIDEARRLRDETLAKALGPKLAAQMSRGGQSALNESGLVTCASRAIIERSQRPKAIVYEGLYSHVNPFDKITDDELEMYRHEIELKQKSASLTHDFGSTIAHDEIEDERRPYSDGEEPSKATQSPGMAATSDGSGPEIEAVDDKKKKRKKRFRFPFLSLSRKKDKTPSSSSKGK